MTPWPRFISATIAAAVGPDIEPRGPGLGDAPQHRRELGIPPPRSRHERMAVRQKQRRARRESRQPGAVPERGAGKVGIHHEPAIRERNRRRCSTSAHGRAPKRWCASQRPATEPGTPAARSPVAARSSGLPFGPMYMSRVAAAGAISRKSSATGGLPAICATMNPPPPILPAAGHTTERANAVATAASTALPPCRSISAPTCVASGASVATMPCAAVTAGASRWYGQLAGTGKGLMAVEDGGSRLARRDDGEHADRPSNSHVA